MRPVAKGDVSMSKKTLVAIGVMLVVALSLFAVSSTFIHNNQVKPAGDKRNTRKAGEAIDVASDFAGEKMFHVDMECQRLHLPTSERLSLKQAINQSYLAESARVRDSGYVSPFNPAVLDQNIPGRSGDEKKLYEALDHNILQQIQKDERRHLSPAAIEQRVDAMNKAGEVEISHGSESR